MRLPVPLTALLALAGMIMFMSHRYFSSEPPTRHIRKAHYNWNHHLREDRQPQQHGMAVELSPDSSAPSSPPEAVDRGCPAVYVYDPGPATLEPFDQSKLSQQLYGNPMEGLLATSNAGGIGSGTVPGETYIYPSNQHSLAPLTIERVLNSHNRRCRREHDPAEPGHKKRWLGGGTSVGGSECGEEAGGASSTEHAVV